MKKLIVINTNSFLKAKLDDWYIKWHQVKTYGGYFYNKPSKEVQHFLCCICNRRESWNTEMQGQFKQDTHEKEFECGKFMTCTWQIAEYKYKISAETWQEETYDKAWHEYEQKNENKILQLYRSNNITTVKANQQVRWNHNPINKLNVKIQIYMLIEFSLK